MAQVVTDYTVVELERMIKSKNLHIRSIQKEVADLTDAYARAKAREYMTKKLATVPPHILKLAGITDDADSNSN